MKRDKKKERKKRERSSSTDSDPVPTGHVSAGPSGGMPTGHASAGPSSGSAAMQSSGHAKKQKKGPSAPKPSPKPPQMSQADLAAAFNQFLAAQGYPAAPALPVPPAPPVAGKKKVEPKRTLALAEPRRQTL